MSTGLGILTTHPDLTVRTWNDWLAAASGLTESDVRGRPLLELVSPQSRDTLSELFSEVLSSGAARVLSSTLHQYLIRCRPVLHSPYFEHMQQSVTVAPMVQEGNVNGLIVTIEEVTGVRDEARALAARIAARDEVPPTDVLLSASVSTDWRVRGAAVQALTASGSDEAVREVLAILERQHLDLNVLSSALQVLVAAGRSVTGPLTRLLKDADSNLRMHAAQALGALRDRSAVPDLIEAVGGDDPNVSFHAIEALGRLKASAAIDALVRTAHSGDFFLAFPAIEALSQIGDSLAAPGLVGLLDDDLLRPAVAEALGGLGDEDCVAPLVQRMNSGMLEPAAAAAAISRIEARYDDGYFAGLHIRDLSRASVTTEGIDRLSRALDARQAPVKPLVRMLGWLGSDAIPSLVRAFDDTSVQLEAAQALESLGHVSVEPVMERLKAGERSTRLTSVALLGRLGDRRATPALVDVLEEGDADLIAAAANSLAALGDAAALPALIPLFADPRVVVRQSAIGAVHSIGSEATEQDVLERLSDKNPHVRECAIRVAGYFGYEQAAEPLAQALNDPDENVRRAAIEQLPLRADRRASDLLVAALQNETPRNRAAAAHALRMVTHAHVEDALLAAVRDPDPWVRYFAADSLAAHDNDRAALVLSDAAEHDVAPQVQIAALRSLSQIHASDLPVLVQRVLAQADDDVACAALAVLGSSTGALGEDMLNEAIHGPSPARRRAAVDALGFRGTEGALRMLKIAARLPVEPPLGPAAIAALGRIAASNEEVAARAAIGALLELGIDADWRRDVIATLARLPHHIDRVQHGLSSSRPAIRRLAVDVLGRMRHAIASVALLEALRDEDPAVRISAIEAIGRLGTLAAAPVVAAMSSTDPDADVRKRAAVICGRHGWRDDPRRMSE
jgi:HEAT repeat protein